MSVVVEERDDVLWVTIDRADRRNALSRAVLAALAETFTAHAAGKTLKAAVLTGAGDQAFAAGGDLREFDAIRSSEAAGDLFQTARRALDCVRHFPVPVVAALNGVALGGGAELAMACDFRLAALHASIGFIHARLNISTGFGGGTDLMRILGPSRALLCALRAEALAAREAQALGLIDEVAAPGESLEQCVTRFLAPILKQAPQVIRAWKAMAIASRAGAPREACIDVELERFVSTWCDADHWTAAERVLKKTPERTPG